MNRPKRIFRKKKKKKNRRNMQFTLSFTIKKEIAFLTYIPTLLKGFKAFFKTTHDLTVLLNVIRYLVDVYKSFKAYEIIHYKKKKKKNILLDWWFEERYITKSLRKWFIFFISKNKWCLDIILLSFQDLRILLNVLQISPFPELKCSCGEHYLI